MALEEKSIEIVFGPDGEISAEVLGVLGPDCAKFSAWLAEGGAILTDTPTADWSKHPRQGLGLGAANHTNLGGLR